MRAHVALPLALLLASGLLMPALAQDEASAQGGEDLLRDAPIVQVLHREARSREGALVGGSRREAADEAAFALTEQAYLLDAWTALAGEGRVALLVLPGAEALADDVAARLTSGSPQGEAVRRASAPAQLSKGERALVLAAPSWREGEVSTDFAQLAAEIESRTGTPPSGFLLDLFETQLDGEPWRADLLLGAGHPRAANLVSEYVLAARARGSIPALPELFARHGVDRSSVRWYRIALP